MADPDMGHDTRDIRFGYPGYSINRIMKGDGKDHGQGRYLELHFNAILTDFSAENTA